MLCELGVDFIYFNLAMNYTLHRREIFQFQNYYSILHMYCCRDA